MAGVCKSLVLAVVLVAIFNAQLYAGPVVIGGYDAQSIVAGTTGLLAKSAKLAPGDARGLESMSIKDSPDPLVAAPEVIAYYDALARLLVSRGIATASEIDALKRTAAASGGVKASGMNPIVLAAAFLNLLSDKGIADIKTAQGIMDGAHVIEKN